MRRTNYKDRIGLDIYIGDTLRIYRYGEQGICEPAKVIDKNLAITGTFVFELGSNDIDIEVVIGVH